MACRRLSASSRLMSSTFQTTWNLSGELVRTCILPERVHPYIDVRSVGVLVAQPRLKLRTRRLLRHDSRCVNYLVAHCGKRARGICKFGILPNRPHAMSVRCLGRTISVLSLDRKSTRLNSSHSQISYAVFCLKKKKK